MIESHAPRFTDQRGRQRQPGPGSPRKLLGTAKQFVLTGVCLWGTFRRPRSEFMPHRLPRRTIAKSGLYIQGTLLNLMTAFGILRRPQLCLAFTGGDFKFLREVLTARLTFSWCDLAVKRGESALFYKLGVCFRQNGRTNYKAAHFYCTSAFFFFFHPQPNLFPFFFLLFCSIFQLTPVRQC